MQSKKQRATAYVRVSTASDSQTHSYEFQSQYWQQEISAREDCEFVGIYADRGISGKTIEKRPQFKAMIESALNGEIDIIFTKSVARFGRNVTELLQTIRLLREQGVAVYFESENINTLDPTSELYLTIAAAVAENDLSVDSDRQNFRIADNFKKGKLGNSIRMYGYRTNENGELEIVPEEVDLVQKIFKLYLDGMSTSKICKTLNVQGYKTLKDMAWSETTVRSMLGNEKYAGDLLLQKFVQINGQSMANNGHKPQYYVENNHVAIIERAVFEKVQKLIKERANPKLANLPKVEYPFTGLVECRNCGAKYTHKINNSGTAWAKAMWSCGKYLKQGKVACDNTGIKDEVLKEKFVECYNEFIRNGSKIAETNSEEVELQNLLKEERELLGLKSRGYIASRDYEQSYQDIMAKIQMAERRIKEKSFKTVRKSDYTEIATFDKEKLEKFLIKVIVDKWTVTFIFIGEVKITKNYTNGRPGNIMDWKAKQKSLRERR